MTSTAFMVGHPWWTALLGVLSLLLTLAIPVGVVLVAVGLLQYFRPEPEPGAFERLRRRYADGEISLSEFEEMRRTLEEGAKP